MRWKRPLFALITVAGLFGAAELGLWLAGVPTLLAERDPFRGFSSQVRVYEADAERGVWRTRRSAVVHSFPDQQFAMEPPANGLRAFVLGGSSAFGFPWGPQSAFARLLGDALRASWPDRSVEVINAAAMSYGSHRLRILTPELLGHRPQVLVIYSGHNEFVERRFYRDFLDGPPRLDVVRAPLYRLRTYAAMTRLWERLRPAARRAPDPEEATLGELLGLDVDREYAVGVGEEERDEARRRFEENLRGVLDDAERAGVRVVLCTVPSNVRGWAPNESAFRSDVGLDGRQQVRRLLAAARTALERGDAAVAARQLEQARGIDRGYAETDYLLGRSYEALGRFDAAAEAYRRARDHDAKPARALGSFNDTIRRLAAERGALLVDVERAFERASPHGLVGFELLEDYVHPNPAGHRLIARELWRAFVENGLGGVAPGKADPEIFRAAVPDGGAPGAVTQGAARTHDLLYNLAVVLEHQGRIDEAMQKYRECLEVQPRFYAARYNLGRLLARQGRFDAAVEAYRRNLELEPAQFQSWIGLGEALRQLGRTDEARQAFARATELDRRSAEAWNRLGVALSELGRFDEAETVLRRAIELEPAQADFHADLGFALLFRNELTAADAAFATALDLEADHVRGRNGLAAVHTERGELDEAERLFRETLSIDPQDAFARGGLDVIRARRAGGAGAG